MKVEPVNKPTFLGNTFLHLHSPLTRREMILAFLSADDYTAVHILQAVWGRGCGRQREIRHRLRSSAAGAEALHQGVRLRADWSTARQRVPRLAGATTSMLFLVHDIYWLQSTLDRVSATAKATARGLHYLFSFTKNLSQEKLNFI